MRHTWTTDDLKILRQLIAEKKTVREMADRFAVSTAALWAVLSRQGLKSGAPVGAPKLSIPPLPDGWSWGITHQRKRSRKVRHLVTAAGITACPDAYRAGPVTADVTISGDCDQCLAVLRRQAWMEARRWPRTDVPS